MEMECAKHSWGRCVGYSTRYKYMISDGDSKSYCAIWNYQYDSTSEEFKAWKASEDYVTKAATEKMKTSYGKAIQNNVKRDINSVEERDAAVYAKQTEIMAGLYHCLKLPEKKGTSTAHIILGISTRKIFLVQINLTIWIQCVKST